MKKVIVTTTIYDKGEAIEKYDAMKDWHLIVVGDKKTPEYNLDNGTFFSIDDQDKYDKELSELIGYNCIQRRNFGFLMAKDMGADIIATVDDDNIPYDNWGEVFIGKQKLKKAIVSDDCKVVDPIYLGSDYKSIWHRGFPIQNVKDRENTHKGVTEDAYNCNIDIQANFWDGDPDIDAICRITQGPECKFDPNRFPFVTDRFAPFNSQNTMVSKYVLPHYFMMPHVGRMDDIWPSYYVQRLNFRVGFFHPTVYQARNPQNLTKNMENEYLGYSNTHRMLDELIESPVNFVKYLPVDAAKAYHKYMEHFE